MRIHGKGLAVCSAVALIASALSSAGAQTQQGAPQGGQQLMQQGGTSAPTPSGKIDINTATKEELQTLPGVDDATAQKIIDNRPYTNKNQLVKKKVVTKAQFKQFKSQIIAKGGKHHHTGMGGSSGGAEQGTQGGGQENPQQNPNPSGSNTP